MSLLTFVDHCLLYLNILFAATWTSSFPVNRINRSSDLLEMDETMEKYLVKFGYLNTQSNSGIHSFRAEKYFRNAVKNFQNYSGLSPTGYIDLNTSALLKKPRCGVPDLSLNQSDFSQKSPKLSGIRMKRFALHGEKWPRLNLTWSLKTLPPMPAVNGDFDRVMIRKQLRMALDLWESPSNLTFTEVSENDFSADIQVFFGRGYHGDGYPFDGPGFVLAHAFFPGPDRGGDVHFDADESWTDGKYSKVNSDTASANLLAVAAHEFGHSLGLSHSSESKSLMFPWYSFKLPMHYKLPKDDFDAIVLLYGKSPDFENEVNNQDYSEDEKESPDEYGQEAEEPIEPKRNFTSEDFDIPSRCFSTFDAVSIIRNEMWAFKGKYFWRIINNEQRTVVNDPVTLSAFWYALPIDQIDHIDAVYERHDHRIVFFIGKFMYVLNGNVNLDSSPIPLTQIGLPDSLEKVDAVFRWGWNGKTYLFSGKYYWRFDEGIQHVELDYPRNISTWNGVPDDIDSAFQHTNGITYFFKGQDFWEFDNQLFKVKNTMGKNIGRHWMQCQNQIEDPFRHSLSKSCDTNSKNFNVFILSVSLLIITTYHNNPE